MEKETQANNASFFERRVRPALMWVGTIGASIMSVAYIIAVVVLVEGFKVDTYLHATIFTVVNALVGFIIMQFLKIQGQSFAQELPDNKKIAEEYYNTQTKDKKPHSMKFYWITSIIKDALIKCITVAALSAGVIYIVIEGSKDYSLFLIAVFNLLLFICFGFIALVKAYEFYNNKHVPFMKDMIKQREQELEKQKLEEIENDKSRQQRIEELGGTSPQE